jgi:hypothetical protein
MYKETKETGGLSEPPGFFPVQCPQLLQLWEEQVVQPEPPLLETSTPLALKEDITRCGAGTEQSGQLRFSPFSPTGHNFSKRCPHALHRNS